MAAVLKLKLSHEVLRVPLCGRCSCKLHSVQLPAFDWLKERGCCPMCPSASETTAVEVLAPAATVAETAQLKFQRDDQVMQMPLCERCTSRMCAMQVGDFDCVADGGGCPMCPATSLETASTAQDEQLAYMLSDIDAVQVESSGDAATMVLNAAAAPRSTREHVRCANASSPAQSATAIAEVRRAHAAVWHRRRQAAAAAAAAATSVAAAAPSAAPPQERRNGLHHVGPLSLRGQRLHLTNGSITGPVRLEACEVFFENVHITGPMCLQSSWVRMQGCRVLGPISLLSRSTAQLSNSMHVGPWNCDSRSSYSLV